MTTNRADRDRLPPPAPLHPAVAQARLAHRADRPRRSPTFLGAAPADLTIAQHRRGVRRRCWIGSPTSAALLDGSRSRRRSVARLAGAVRRRRCRPTRADTTGWPAAAQSAPPTSPPGRDHRHRPVRRRPGRRRAVAAALRRLAWRALKGSPLKVADVDFLLRARRPDRQARAARGRAARATSRRCATRSAAVDAELAVAPADRRPRRGHRRRWRWSTTPPSSTGSSPSSPARRRTRAPLVTAEEALPAPLDARSRRRSRIDPFANELDVRRACSTRPTPAALDAAADDLDARRRRRRSTTQAGARRVHQPRSRPPSGTARRRRRRPGRPRRRVPRAERRTSPSPTRSSDPAAQAGGDPRWHPPRAAGRAARHRALRTALDRDDQGRRRRDRRARAGPDGAARRRRPGGRHPRRPPGARDAGRARRATGRVELLARPARDRRLSSCTSPRRRARR